MNPNVATLTATAHKKWPHNYTTFTVTHSGVGSHRIYKAVTT